MAYFDRKEDYGYICWAHEVKQRDHHTCVVCGRRGVPLNSHHLNAWASFPNERYDVDNGVSLCTDDHDRFHEIYGKGKNTKAQFKEYKTIMGVIIKKAQEEVSIETASRRMLQAAERDSVVQEILQDMETRYGSQRTSKHDTEQEEADSTEPE